MDQMVRPSPAKVITVFTDEISTLRIDPVRAGRKIGDHG
jgi:hypothetical protein